MPSEKLCLRRPPYQVKGGRRINPGGGEVGEQLSRVRGRFAHTPQRVSLDKFICQDVLQAKIFFRHKKYQGLDCIYKINKKEPIK